MPEKEVQLRATIHYYGVLKLLKSMQTACLEGVRLFASDHRFRFYFALSLLFEGRLQESIRELDSLQDKKDLSLGCYLALIHAHKTSKSPDVQACQDLETSLRENRRTASDEGLFFAGLVLLLTDKTDKAVEYLDKLLIKFPNYKDGRILRGWTDLVVRMQSSSQTSSQTSSNYFEVSSKAGNVEGMLGQGMLSLVKGHPDMDLFSKLTSNWPNFIPGFIESMKAFLHNKDWDAVLESSSKLMSLDRHSIEGLRFEILDALVFKKHGNEYLISRLKDLSTALELREPKNGVLYLETSALLSSVCQCNPEVIRSTITLADRAANLDPSFQVRTSNQVAKQHCYLNRISDAKRHFSNANKISPRDMNRSL